MKVNINNNKIIDDDGDDDSSVLEDSEASDYDINNNNNNNNKPNILKDAIKSKSLDSSKRNTTNLAALSDSEGEDGDINRIGNIPIEWYDDYDHIGYDIYGKRIARKNRGDALDELIARDDPNYWRTIYDKVNDVKVVLSDNELRLLHRIRRRQYPDPQFNPEEDYTNWNAPKHIESLHNGYEPKRRFIPSKWEAKQVVKYITAIRNGWLRDPSEKEKVEDSYLLWGAEVDDENDDDNNVRKRLMTIPPPKPKLPGHAESYNPPEEYLPSDKQLKEWEEMDEEERPFIPQKFSSMRDIPSYPRFINERFERCLDLYMCVRTRRERLNIDPESLIPKLPNPKDLRPFPTKMVLEYKGHTDKISCLAISPDGQWLASGSFDHTVRIWEVDSGRCFYKRNVGAIVRSLAFNPLSSKPILLVGAGNKVILLHSRTGNNQITDDVRRLFLKEQEVMEDAINSNDNNNNNDNEKNKNSKLKLKWKILKDDAEYKDESEDEDDDSDEDEKDSIHPNTDANNIEPAELSALTDEFHRIEINMQHLVKQVVWHRKGDYFASLSSDPSYKAIMIHRLSKKQSQAPFNKGNNHAERIMFHPSKPHFFVVTRRNIRVYDLMQQRMIKKLLSSSQWLSSIDVHNGGDNLIVGSYDRRVCWYDMDLSSKPYRTLKYHTKAVRSVAFHSSYPLFASASDDGKVHIFHGMVYSDLLTNPLIVPVKILDAHKPIKDLGVLTCCFHPNQPHLFTGGADGHIKLFV